MNCNSCKSRIIDGSGKLSDPSCSICFENDDVDAVCDICGANLIDDFCEYCDS